MAQHSKLAASVNLIRNSRQVGWDVRVHDGCPSRQCCPFMQGHLPTVTLTLQTHHLYNQLYGNTPARFDPDSYFLLQLIVCRLQGLCYVNEWLRGRVSRLIFIELVYAGFSWDRMKRIGQLRSYLQLCFRSSEAYGTSIGIWTDTDALL